MKQLLILQKQLRKFDSKTNEQVGGATYAIYNQQGQELERLVTTATGYVESGYLRFGEYRVKRLLRLKDMF